LEWDDQRPVSFVEACLLFKLWSKAVVFSDRGPEMGVHECLQMYNDVYPHKKLQLSHGVYTVFEWFLYLRCLTGGSSIKNTISVCSISNADHRHVRLMFRGFFNAQETYERLRVDLHLNQSDMHTQLVYEQKASRVQAFLDTCKRFVSVFF